MASRVLKLGTRKSLLAWAQSSWVAREIEKKNPGVRVELVGIETTGDRIQDVSLQVASQMTGGKEFFVKEIDEALSSGAVDLTVHSMKDLSLDRPAELINAATPPRENPRDVVLFGPGVMERLRSGKQIRIGTSSPRRLENIPAFLSRALPHSARLEFVEIRGNVNTRLGRVHEAQDSQRHLDAVVLAFAGLIRLWKDEKAREEMRRLLEGVRWMILPLRECPAAPAQGALSIECRRADAEVLSMIRRIHCKETEADVSLERGLLAQWGGGCHQKFGATAISTPAISSLFFIRGKKPDQTFVDELRWSRPSAPSGVTQAWDGSEWRRESQTEYLPDAEKPVDAPAVFISHWRSLEKQSPSGRIWASGVSSWFKLAEKGLWVEGCAENLGFESIRKTIAEEVLQLPPFKSWTVLTHEGAERGWDTRVIPTYRLKKSGYPDRAKQALKQATHVFWSSASQFDELKDTVPQNAHQACGVGRTYEHLTSCGVKPVVFPTAEEWRKWIKGE